MTTWLLLAGAVAALVAWLFVRSERSRAHSVLALASDLEARGEYEASCFHYAVALSAGASAAEYKANVRRLWSAHGPFTFATLAGQLRSDYCRSESCGEGYHAITVADIQRIVDGSRSTPGPMMVHD
jgi:hypothetical protein